MLFRSMSPATRQSCRLLLPPSRHTLAILEPPLDHGIVDVCVDLELVQVALHALDAMLVPLLILRLHGSGLQSLDSLCFRLNVVDLFLAVLDEDLARFLETLER